jgi:hypothetical protein
MLKIQRSANGEVVFTLSGQMGQESVAELEQLIRVWLLWNHGPRGVEAALVLSDVEFPVGIEVS